MKSLRLALAPVLALVLIAGCASAGGMSGAMDDESLTVRVDNGLIPAASVNVWLISESGFRDMLGRVSPNSVRSLDARSASSLGEYRLIAERTGGREVVSRPFYLTRAAHTVRWDLSTNTVTVVEN